MDETAFTCEECLATYAAGIFKAALGGAAEGFEARVAPATDRRFGDFQCNDALALGKALKRPPRKIAEQIAAAMSPL
ncbi:MAG: hypothetical protein FWF96_03145, partial [Kiritimatiellaeota bacterium]|nr:hypothetical protein [Kiritimatiellota bacterium]